MIKWSIINNFRLSLVHVQDKNKKDKYRNNENVFSWLCILLAMFFVANYRFLVSTLFLKKKPINTNICIPMCFFFFLIFLCC